MINRKEFSKYWYKKVKSIEENNEYKFFNLYVSFNALYNKYSNRFERNRIKHFLKADQNSNVKLSIKKDGDFYQKLVMDMRTGEEINNRSYKLSEIRNNDIVAIFMGIYQVRCNLFHGSKKDYDRDKNLIVESCILLENFLTSYFKQ